MKWFYLRDEKNQRVACVVSEKVVNRVGEINIPYAVSTYNPVDKFNTELARKVAVGRLNNGIGTKCTGILMNVKTGIKELLVRRIAENEDMPGRARQAAALWIKKCEAQKEIAIENTGTGAKQ